MKRITIILTTLVLILGCNNADNTIGEEYICDVPGFVLADENIKVKIGEDGSLLVLSNAETGHNYASGKSLWIMFYNTHEDKEMQIDCSENTPTVSQEGNAIVITLPS